LGVNDTQFCLTSGTGVQLAVSLLLSLASVLPEQVLSKEFYIRLGGQIVAVESYLYVSDGKGAADVSGSTSCCIVAAADFAPRSRRLCRAWDAGSLYGTTRTGGATGFGVVYQLDAAGRETVLYNFTGGADGGEPTTGVIRDSAGNLYGTTAN
jgi:uncharacterized repeat protein (TIGR03803 family)